MNRIPSILVLALMSLLVSCVTDADNNRIRKITPADRIEDRVVSTFTGSGTESSGNGTGTAAQFNDPTGVAVDSSGNVFVADFSNHRIRKITPAGVVSTLAGTGTLGHTDGASNTAQFNSPIGVAVDSESNVYVTDFSNNRIRKIEYKVPWAATR